MVHFQLLLLSRADCSLFEVAGQKDRGLFMNNATEIQADFDRIAPLEPSGGWNHNSHYHGFLLRHAPTLCEVRRACAGLLPGARALRHLLWRYSRVWTKP
jgi:hypothetical protein